jgi:hypothetical protein
MTDDLIPRALLLMDKDVVSTEKRGEREAVFYGNCFFSHAIIPSRLSVGRLPRHVGMRHAFSIDKTQYTGMRQSIQP